MKREKFPNSREPSHRWVCGEFWNFRGQHNWEKKKKHTEYAPNRNCQWRGSPEAHFCHSYHKDSQEKLGGRGGPKMVEE